MKKIILISFFLASSGALFAITPAELKQLIPAGAVIKNNGHCVRHADLDNDGKEELAVVYGTGTAGDCVLSIFKKINNKWTGQYTLNCEKGQKEAASFEIGNLTNSKYRQIILNAGAGAASGYCLNIIQFDGKEYKSLFPYNYPNWGVRFEDIDNDGIKEIIEHNRYSELPIVYEWIPAKSAFEPLIDNKNKLHKYYRSILKDIKDTYAVQFDPYKGKYGWALFVIYRELGDYDNALMLGQELTDPKYLSSDWFDSVAEQLKEIKNSTK